MIDPDISGWRLVSTLFVWCVVAWVGIHAFRHFRRLGIPPVRWVGLARDSSWWSDCAAGLAIGALGVGAAVAIEAGSGWIRIDYAGAAPLVSIAWMLLLPFSAMAEEILFRGVLLGGLAILVKRRDAALMLMAVLFGLSHAIKPHATPLSIVGNAVGGLIYGLAFFGSERLWLGIGIHTAWNALQGPILGLPVSGSNLGGLVRLVADGPETWTGGAYGPEAGIAGFAGRIVVLVLLWRWWVIVYRRSAPAHVAPPERIEPL